MWARDLEDIYDALVDVRSGLDYYDRALLGPGPDAGDSATILTRLDLEAGLTDGAGTAPLEAKAPPRRAGRVPSKAYPAGLSAREVEVLRLIARGKTSKEIAAGLIVTVATVSRHIANIYTKIDARGRADATRYAYEHGLAESEDGESGIPSRLAPREADVLRLIAEGNTNRQIAARLGVSPAVVQQTIAAITAKIGAQRPDR